MKRSVRFSTVLVSRLLLVLFVVCTGYGTSQSADPASGQTSNETSASLRAHTNVPDRTVPIQRTQNRTTRDRLAMARRIDALLEQRWQAEGITPAPIASDSEFLRRAYLDLTGVIPRVAEVRTFLADEMPDKRGRLIETLLESPRYATHMATTWHNRLIPYGAEPQRESLVIGLQNWLRAQFAENRRFDGIVGDLLVATQGNDLGEALFFNTYDLAPEKLAASSAELFLGIRLQCAQCHDHPYGHWTQEDFWGYAAFFARVREPDRSSRGNSYRLVDVKSGEVVLPDSDQVVPPKYLGGRLADDSMGGTRRQQLAIWMVSRDNPYLNRAVVNWAWAHLFGLGLVEPVGDAGDHNPPSHPMLLEELAKYFAQSGCDTKQLWRTLARTRAYGLSSQSREPEPSPSHLFASMTIKSFTPEQLYDCMTRATLASERPVETMKAETVAVRAGGVTDPRRAEFVRRMRSPARSPTEFSSGILQSLTIMNGSTMANLTDRDDSGLLVALDAQFMTEQDQVEALFLATLSRFPRAEERQAHIRYLKEMGVGTDRRKAISDILWALLNSSEFAFNR